MSKFNAYMNSHFSGCRLLARARDDCRERDVTLHQIPGYWDVIGVTDGTDAWVAPASAAPFFRTATGDVVKIMKCLEAGEPVPPVPEAPQKRRRATFLAPPDVPSPTPRRAILDAAVTTGRRHVRFA